DLGAVIGRRSAPQRETLLGGFERGVEIGLAGVRQMGERLLGRRVEHVLALAAAAVMPLAVDVEREIGIHGFLVAFGVCPRAGRGGISTFPDRIHPRAVEAPLSFQPSAARAGIRYSPACVSPHIEPAAITGFPLVRAWSLDFLSEHHPILASPGIILDRLTCHADAAVKGDGAGVAWAGDRLQSRTAPATGMVGKVLVQSFGKTLSSMRAPHRDQMNVSGRFRL